MSNFDLSALAIKALCPNNEIIYDDKGLPSVMVKIPKMTYAQLGLGTSAAVFPAFIVNGEEVDAVYISKYQNIVRDGRAYSLPGEDPQASVDFGTSLSVCSAKGNGWHLMTRFEWMVLALWCKANGTTPKGNNNYGKDVTDNIYSAIPTSREADGRIARVATGTGPLSWSHDGTPSGVFDLNGNVWEWSGGIRLVFGELQILTNNNAADPSNSQNADSAQWKAIDATSGALVTPNGKGTTSNSLKIDWVSSHGQWTSSALASKQDVGVGCSFESVTIASTVGTAAALVLQSLGLYKYDTTAGAYLSDHFYINNGAEERVFLGGGTWFSGSLAGVFSLHATYSRLLRGAVVGFRSAFVKLPSV